jgi:phospholipase/carboxylesterase
MNSGGSSTIERRPSHGKPDQLFVLLHGVGANAEGLVPLADLIQQHFPYAAILVPQGFEPCDLAPVGRQWFSVREISEENRPGRVAEALPALVQFVRQAQERLDLPPAATTLIGFSQGAIMALEAAAAHDDLAGQVVAFAGRFATLPAHGSRRTTIHLLHGEDDMVMPSTHSRAAFERLREDGCEVTLDTLAGCGHELHPVLVAKALERLKA